jgi:hypothetical protein
VPEREVSGIERLQGKPCLIGVDGPVLCPVIAVDPSDFRDISYQIDVGEEKTKLYEPVQYMKYQITLVEAEVLAKQQCQKMGNCYKNDSGKENT